MLCLELDLRNFFLFCLLGEFIRSGRESLSSFSCVIGASTLISSSSESEFWGDGVGCL